MEHVVKVNRWGNSLAVRIPGDVAERLGLREGDDVVIRVDDDGTFRVARDERRERALERLMTLGWDIPAGFSFSRDEANERG